ncbi:hypothetical protein V070_02425 [Staphylococcus aureus C0673]|nr:hypothetical protein V070_02425 [Staphylococcus aureus C0673]
MMIFTKGIGKPLKNILLVVIILCLTVLSAVLMLTTDNDSKNNKTTNKEKTEQSTKKRDETQKKKEKDFNIKTQQDLAEIIYSKQDEQTKMNAYNEAVKKGILPRSDHYQESVYAYEESVRLKEKDFN